MSILQREVFVATIHKWFKVLGFIVLILSLNVFYTELRISVVKQESWIEYRYVFCQLQIFYPNSDCCFIDLIRDDSIVEANSVSGEQRLTYAFITAQLNLFANFSKIQIVFQVDKNTFMSFEQIQARFYIEDHTDIIRKYDFDLSNEGLPFYIAIRDVSNLMWKEDVPDEVKTSIIFING